MGWGRMLLLGNVGQQMDIGDLENAIEEMQVMPVGGTRDGSEEHDKRHRTTG